MDVMYILKPISEFKVTDHYGIHPLDHGVSMLIIKLEVDRGSPM